MADYRKLFEQALLKNQEVDPAQKQLEDQIMRPNDGASIAPTMGLVDHLTGSNFASMVPKQEGMKEKLGQLLQARQASKGQQLDGLGKLAQMQNAAEERAMERAFKEKMFGLQALQAKAKMAKGNTPKVGAEDKKALGFTQSLMSDLQKYKESLKGNGITPTMWSKVAGDNPTMAIRNRLIENYGRLQSGGAISGDEEARFGASFGSFMDSPEVVQEKLKLIEEEIMRKNELYGGAGFVPTTGGSRMPSGGSASKGSAVDLTQLNLDEMSDEEIMALQGMM